MVVVVVVMVTMMAVNKSIALLSALMNLRFVTFISYFSFELTSYEFRYMDLLSRLRRIPRLTQTSVSLSKCTRLPFLFAFFTFHFMFTM